MKIEYRPADYTEELRPIAEKFFQLYELRGVSGIRVEASINKLTPGIMICPEKGSVIEEICIREVSAIGRLVRAGKEYVTLDIDGGQRCLVHFEYQAPVTRE